ncbi:ribose-phosphate pyrophosphokinase [Paenibacillus sp. GCM10027627]|uniref:ribose-phosphate pyrophosphokinase n=1 Tax=unclassified Paenibacillus TaxID=185978 RepID=UPI0036395F3C
MIKLNGKVLDFEKFPNGETRVNGEQINVYQEDVNQIEFKYKDDSDLIKLLFVKRHLDKLNTRTYLIVYYMPYSRMDRVEGDSVFTLKYVSELINSLNFEQVTIVEPHSDVTPALINKSKAIYPSLNLLKDVVKEVGFNADTDYLFFPDQGAAKRYSKIEGYKSLVGFKERDFQTGQINSLQLVGEKPQHGFKAIIVDDLCSFGGTFILSAEQLKAAGATEIYLLVAHCEESIYKGKIFNTDLINKVFTTNTIIKESKNEKIKLFNHIGGKSND